MYKKQMLKIAKAMEILNEVNNEFRLIEEKKNIKPPYRILAARSIDSAMDSALGEIYNQYKETLLRGAK